MKRCDNKERKTYFTAKWLANVNRWSTKHTEPQLKAQYHIQQGKAIHHIPYQLKESLEDNLHWSNRRSFLVLRYFIALIVTCLLSCGHRAYSVVVNSLIGRAPHKRDDCARNICLTEKAVESKASVISCGSAIAISSLSPEHEHDF